MARSDVGPVLIGAAAGLSAISRAVSLFSIVNGSAVMSLLGGRGLGTVGKHAAGVDATASATSRLTTSLAGVGKTAAGVAGLGLAFADFSDGSDRAMETLESFTNIAGGALAGFAVGGPVGAAIGGGVTAIGELIGALDDSGESAQVSAGFMSAYADSLNQVTGAATQSSREIVAQELEALGALEAIQTLNAGLGTDLADTDLVSAIIGDPGAFDTFAGELDDVRARIDEIRAAAQVLGSYPELGPDRFGETQADLDAAQAVLDKYSVSAGEAAVLVDVLDGAMGGLSGSTRDAAEGAERIDAAARSAAAGIGEEAQAARQAIAAHNALADALLAASSANIAYEQAVDDAMKEARKGAATLDITTQAGRDNRDALDQVAASWNNLSDRAQTMPGAFREAKASFVDIAMAMGASREQAERLAARLLEIPRETKPRVRVDGTEEAMDHIGQVRGGLEDLDATDPRVDIRANDYASGTIQDVAARLQALNGTSATTTIRTIYENTVVGGVGNPGVFGLNKAHGGIVEFNAHGGIRENHVAQFAPAGALRVWAEDETPGEAYIPLPRSRKATL